MQHPVLQVAVGRAHRAVEPRRHEDAHRGDAVRVHVEEAEDLRLRDSRRCGAPCPAASVAVLGQVDHHLHADRPVARVVPLGHAEARRRAARPTAPTGPSPTTVSAARTSMPGMKPASGCAVARRRPGRPGARPPRCSPSMSGSATGVPGQICTAPARHHLLADPLVELAQREDEPAVLVQEVGRPGQRRARRPRTAARRAGRGWSRRPARSAAERRLAPTGSSR